MLFIIITGILFYFKHLEQTQPTAPTIWAKAICMSMEIYVSKSIMETGTGKPRDKSVSTKEVILYNLDLPACKSTSGSTYFPRCRSQRKTGFGLEQRIYIRNLIGDGFQVRNLQN